MRGDVDGHSLAVRNDTLRWPTGIGARMIKQRVIRGHHSRYSSPTRAEKSYRGAMISSSDFGEN